MCVWVSIFNTRKCIWYKRWIFSNLYNKKIGIVNNSYQFLMKSYMFIVSIYIQYWYITCSKTFLVGKCWYSIYVIYIYLLFSIKSAMRFTSQIDTFKDHADRFFHNWRISYLVTKNYLPWTWLCETKMTAGTFVTDKADGPIRAWQNSIVVPSPAPLVLESGPVDVFKGDNRVGGETLGISSQQGWIIA